MRIEHDYHRQERHRYVRHEPADSVRRGHRPLRARLSPSAHQRVGAQLPRIDHAIELLQRCSGKIFSLRSPARPAGSPHRLRSMRRRKPVSTPLAEGCRDPRHGRAVDRRPSTPGNRTSALSEDLVSRRQRLRPVSARETAGGAAEAREKRLCCGARDALTLRVRPPVRLPAPSRPIRPSRRRRAPVRLHQTSRNRCCQAASPRRFSVGLITQAAREHAGSGKCANICPTEFPSDELHGVRREISSGSRWRAGFVTWGVNPPAP